MRKYFLILLVIFMLFISSCASYEGDANGAADGVSFDYFTSYVIEDKTFDVFIPNVVDDAIYYQYKLGNVTSKSEEWIINFPYQAIYHVNDDKESKEVWSSLYENLLDNVEFLKEKCEFNVNLFDPYESKEVEYVLYNETKEEASYVIFQTYLPIRLVNKTERVTMTVGVPVNLDVLLKIGDTVENPFADEMISWEDFLAL